MKYQLVTLELLQPKRAHCIQVLLVSVRTQHLNLLPIRLDNVCNPAPWRIGCILGRLRPTF